MRHFSSVPMPCGQRCSPMSSQASWGVIGGAPGGLPTPYRDGIFNLLGITVSWGPHQAHNQPLKLPRQLILEVCNEVLAEGEKRGWGTLCSSASLSGSLRGNLRLQQGQWPGSISAVTFP